MKHYFFILTLCTLPCLALAQNKGHETVIKYDSNGKISSIKFSKTDSNFAIPASSGDFFSDYLKITLNDNFKKVPLSSKIKSFVDEHYYQYYKGIKVDGAEYYLHYKNGELFYANGHYVDIKDMDTNPTLKAEDAKVAFAKYKEISLDSILNYKVELIIKEVPEIDNGTFLTPKLVYRVWLDSESRNNTEIGFIDAVSGKILMTIPIYESISGNGTLATRYSSIQMGTTYFYNTNYHLNDSSRGANIHVMNLQGSTSISNFVELSDADNNWTSAEHSASKNDMGLDVYWAQQKIYDYLNINYGLNSFDDNGGDLTSYIRYGSNNSYADNAGWSSTLQHFIFGTGYTWFKPVASIDAVAHEYGHALTTSFIGWGNNCFNEGLSDIWSAILEYRIKPNSTWKIGEQIDLSYGCLRNLQTTNDNNARTKMANTYGTTSYFNYNEDDQIYYRAGVFSHWFYLLVNGGSGTNGLGNAYNVYGTGMSTAEQLIAYSVSGGYLSGTTSYADIRDVFVIVADDVLCLTDNSILRYQIESAWYAVGVGSQPLTPTISGSTTLVCYSSNSGTFTLSNCPSGATITWTNSNNTTYMSGQGTPSYVVKACSGITCSGSGWVTATMTSGSYSLSITYSNFWAGPPTCEPSGPTEGIPYNTYTFYANAGTYSAPTSYNWILSPVLDNNLYSYGSYADIAFYTEYSNYQVVVRAANTCGTGQYGVTNINISDGGKGISSEAEPEVKGYTLYPNPASESVTINTIISSGTKKKPSDSKSYKKEPSTYLIKIVDLSGIVHYSTEGSGYSYTFPVNTLKIGQYIVIINDGLNNSTIPLLIKH